MKFAKSTGAWLDKSTLENGQILTLVTEAIEQEGQSGSQIVAKAKIEGQDGEARNVAINGASKNGLIDAFGADSLNWMNKPLTVNVERTTIGGKRAYVLYLIPEGFEMVEDSEGYVAIKRRAEEGASNY